MSEEDVVEEQERFDHDFYAWLQALEDEIELTRKSERLTAADLSTLVR